MLCLFFKNNVYICNMKRKKTIKLILILLVLNLILSLYNLSTNIQQTESIKFNEKLYDVFLEKVI